MSNASTIRRQILGTQQLTIASVTNAGSAAPTAFVLNNNGLTLTGGGVIPLSAGPGPYKGTGNVIKVIATGNFVAAADDDLTLTLYIVPASVIAAGTVGGVAFQTFTNWLSVCATTLQVIDSLASSFSFEADLQVSSTGYLEGNFIYNIGILPSPPAWAVTSAIAGTSLPAGDADLNFVLVYTLASTGTGTVLNLEEFRVDAA